MNEWTVASARQNFSSLLDACRTDIQPIYRRNQLVAGVVNAETYQRLQTQTQQRPSLADSFRELRQILADTSDDFLPSSNRNNRSNAFMDVLGE
jgi:PHD/YefM family antitoxin component YafN of YafNO toxin-antitoxin module